MNIRIVIVIILMLVASLELIFNDAKAGEVGLILGSRHFDTDKEYNEVNPGVYYIDEGYIVGAYKNSYSEPVVFAGGNVDYKVTDKIRVSLGYGLIYGYGWEGGLASSEISGRKVLPFVLPTISVWKAKDLYFNVHIIGKAVGWSISKTF